MRRYGRASGADLARNPARSGLRFEIWAILAGRFEWALERKISEIAAATIVAGEVQFRRGLRESEKLDEQFRRWQEEQRKQAIARRNQERLQHLRESCALLRQAQDLRALIERVGDAVVAGSVDVDGATIEAWKGWASAEADRLDPILSGQIMTHLASPPDEDS